MKISIITFHNTSNFGATLQCVAFSKYLESLGHEVVIVNYLPEYVRNKISSKKELKNISKSKNKIKAIIKGLAYFSYSHKINRRNKCFDSFISENLNLSIEYNSYEELANNSPKADIYICGSDQIWNPSLTGNVFDKAFFLQYADGSKNAYGVSIGELNVSTNAEELRKLVEGYRNISVREKSVAPLLSSAINKPVDVVLDCTLLLNKSVYSDLEHSLSIFDEPYVLVYNVQNSNLAADLAKKISENKKLKIIDISPNPFFHIRGSKKHIDIGPGEFLFLIHNASCVVTNSFHGTVFSIIYEKEFYSFAHSKRSGRVKDLL